MSSFNEIAAREIFLNPGDIGCGFRDEVFGTLLGSCVSIVLWHPKRQFGSISHFIFPSTVSGYEANTKYGNWAFAQQKNDLIRHGVNLRECVVKIFGGGRMFVDSNINDVGARNIAAARQLIAKEGLVITSENVGGDGYRRLYFDVESGEVWVKFDLIDSDQEDKVL